MMEKLMPKGWTKLVDEAVERIIGEEIERQLSILFPDTKEAGGFDYSMGQYIQKRWTEIIKADEEIDDMIRDGLRRVLTKGFGEKPE